MPFKTSALSAIAAYAALALTTLPVSAGLIEGPSRTTTPTEKLMSLFSSTCYETVPNMAAVETAADAKGWQEVKGSALAAYKPQAESKALKAWRLGRNWTSFAVAYAVTDVPAEMGAQLPAFAGGEAHSCSIVSRTMDHAATTAALSKLIGRVPDTEFDQGPLKARAWIGVTEDFAVFVYHYRPANGGKNGLVSIMAIPRP